MIGTAHCADMYASSPSDLPQLTAARVQIVQFLGQILGKNNQQKFQRNYNADSGSSYEESNSASSDDHAYGNAESFWNNNNELSNEMSNESSEY